MKATLRLRDEALGQTVVEVGQPGNTGVNDIILKLKCGPRGNTRSQTGGDADIGHYIMS